MIHIVGAGPGDPELITRKGARLLSEADVVIYAGSLVNPKLTVPLTGPMSCTVSGGAVRKSHKVSSSAKNSKTGRLRTSCSYRSFIRLSSTVILMKTE